MSMMVIYTRKKVHYMTRLFTKVGTFNLCTTSPSSRIGGKNCYGKMSWVMEMKCKYRNKGYR